MSACTFFGHRECFDLEAKQLMDAVEQLILRGVPVCDYHRAAMNLEKVFMEVTQDA